MPYNGLVSFNAASYGSETEIYVHIDYEKVFTINLYRG